MENFVGGIFSTKDQAIAAHVALLQLSQQGSLSIESAAVYGRNSMGDLAPVDGGAGNPNDLEFADGGSGQEALDELNESLPEGAYVLLAHVVESDPSIVDAAVTSAGGTVERRSLGQLDSAASSRFADAD
jgi:hypothetical protein